MADRRTGTDDMSTGQKNWISAAVNDPRPARTVCCSRACRNTPFHVGYKHPQQITQTYDMSPKRWIALTKIKYGHLLRHRHFRLDFKGFRMISFTLKVYFKQCLWLKVLKLQASSTGLTKNYFFGLLEKFRSKDISCLVHTLYGECLHVVCWLRKM